MSQYELDHVAEPGTIFVCGACGKRNRTQMPGPTAIDRGWDESCMLHSVLCDETSIVMDGNRVVKADAVGLDKAPDSILSQRSKEEEGK